MKKPETLFYQYILEHAVEKGLFSDPQIARAAHLTTPTIKRIRYDTKRLQSRTLKQLADALDLNFMQVKRYYLDVEGQFYGGE